MSKMTYTVTADHEPIAKFVLAADAQMFAESLSNITAKTIRLETRDYTTVYHSDFIHMIPKEGEAK